jgi:hypothetical protein
VAKKHRQQFYSPEALSGSVVECIIGLLETALSGGLSNEQGGGEQRTAVGGSRAAGYPAVPLQLLHGQPLPGIHRQQALRQVLGRR